MPNIGEIDQEHSLLRDMFDEFPALKAELSDGLLREAARLVAGDLIDVFLENAERVPARLCAWIELTRG